MPSPIKSNMLYYGDNLEILREYIGDASVDLIYLDPPFNSNRNYNVLFRHEGGAESEAQVQAFEDTWHWNQRTAKLYEELVTQSRPEISSMIAAMRQFIGQNQMMAYVVNMAIRLVELHRVLKPTGSLYLHCDPTASHYLKVVLDTIFGPKNYKNEIVWKRSAAHNDTKQGMQRYGRIRDVIFFYTKSDTYVWNPQYTAYSEEYLQSEYRHVDAKGRYYKETDLTAAKPGGDTEFDWNVKRRAGTSDAWGPDLSEEYRIPIPGWEYRSVRPYRGRYWAYSKENIVKFALEGHLIHRKTGMPRLVQYADEMPGIALQDLWSDIPPASGDEDLGYDTQKPIALLKRIITASSNPGDVILDPFCGCGTTIAAAQKLERTWVGIDITTLAVALQKIRLKSAFDLVEGKNYRVVGEPADVASAQQLASENRYQFQWWALSLIQAQPLGGDGGRQGKKGADRGIDGIITFIDDASGKPKRVLVQVKSGHVNSATIRDLRGVVEREGGAIGVLITLEAPSQPMATEAAAAGFYASPNWGSFPRLQILTVDGLLHKRQRLEMPPQQQTAITFKQAPREKGKPKGEQPGLGLEV